jgi:hypothetical protein
MLYQKLWNCAIRSTGLALLLAGCASSGGSSREVYEGVLFRGPVQPLKSNDAICGVINHRRPSSGIRFESPVQHDTARVDALGFVYWSHDNKQASELARYEISSPSPVRHVENEVRSGSKQLAVSTTVGNNKGYIHCLWIPNIRGSQLFEGRNTLVVKATLKNGMVLSDSIQFQYQK